MYNLLISYFFSTPFWKHTAKFIFSIVFTDTILLVILINPFHLLFNRWQFFKILCLPHFKQSTSVMLNKFLYHLLSLTRNINFSFVSFIFYRIYPILSNKIFLYLNHIIFTLQLLSYHNRLIKSTFCLLYLTFYI